MQLFYNSDIKQGDSNFFFDKEESKHIVKVLRKKESDKSTEDEVKPGSWHNSGYTCQRIMRNSWFRFSGEKRPPVWI